MNVFNFVPLALLSWSQLAVANLELDRADCQAKCDEQYENQRKKCLEAPEGISDCYFESVRSDYKCYLKCELNPEEAVNERRPVDQPNIDRSSPSASEIDRIRSIPRSEATAFERSIQDGNPPEFAAETKRGARLRSKR